MWNNTLIYAHTVLYMQVVLIIWKYYNNRIMNKYIQHMQHIVRLCCPTKMRFERETERFLAYKWVIERHATLCLFIIYILQYIIGIIIYSIF